MPDKYSGSNESGDCIYRNVPKYRNELEIPKRTIKYIGKCRFGSLIVCTKIEKVLKNVCTGIDKLLSVLTSIIYRRK